MSYNPKEKTITLQSDADFLPDSGEFFIDTLRQLAGQADAPKRVKEDWNALKEWAGCSEGQKWVHEEYMPKLREAWSYYTSIGVAPSVKLQESFDHFHKLNIKDSKQKPPSEIMDIFDRLLATEAEIKLKKELDLRKEEKKFEQIFKKHGKFQTNFLQNKFRTKFSRAALIISTLWVVWTIFRTADDHELFGVYLDNWDDDMFLINAFVPIASVFIVKFLVNWIKKAE